MKTQWLPLVLFALTSNLLSLSAHAGDRGKLEARITALEQKFKPGSMEDILNAVRGDHGVLSLTGENLILNGMTIPFLAVVRRDGTTLENKPDLICRFFGFSQAEIYSVRNVGMCSNQPQAKFIELADGRIQVGTVIPEYRTGCGVDNQVYQSLICSK